jgi:hypothetical protein
MPAYLLDPQLPPGAYQLTVPGSARDRVMPLSELARALGIQ